MKRKNNLSKLRERKGITQKVLCEELEKRGCFITRSAYSKYETGDRNIPCDTLIDLAELFGTSIDCVLGLVDI